MKHILRTLSLLILCALLAFAAVATAPGDYGYYDANGDGKVEIRDALTQIKALLNGNDPDYSLVRILRVLRATTSSEAVDATLTRLDTEAVTAVFTVGDTKTEYALPLAALGLDGTANASVYAGASLVLTVPEPAADFFAAYDATKVYAAAIDPDSLTTYTAETRILETFADKQTGELYVFTELTDAEIPAKALGITADMPRSGYLGLPVTLEITCEEDAFAEAYANGAAAILSCMLPQYTTVVNLDGEITSAWMQSDEAEDDYRVLNVGGTQFALDDYSTEYYELDEAGWVCSGDWIADFYETDEETGKYLDPEGALSSLSYRTVEYEDGKRVLELLYAPVALAQYRTRTLADATSGTEYVYTTVGRFEDYEGDSIDGVRTWFIEYFLDDTRLLDVVKDGTVQDGRGTSSRNVTLRGETVAEGGFMYYTYYAVDRALTVHESLGNLQYGTLEGMVFTEKALTVNGKTYPYAACALSEFDHYRVMEILETDADGYNTVQYLTRNGELLFMAEYTDPASVPTYDFAIVSLDHSIMADLLGLTETAYYNALVDYRFYVENGMVVAAFLNTETGEWEKGYVEAVATGYNGGEFCNLCNLAESAVYNAVGVLQSEAGALYTVACQMLEQPFALVVSETDGVYTLADRNLWGNDAFLLPRGNADDGVRFDENGLTNPLSATESGKKTAIQTTEDTLLVAFNNYALGIRRGVQDERSSLYSWAEIYAASEDLIVFYTSDEPYEWQNIPVKSGDERYYTVTADSEFTVTRTDDGFVLTLTEAFDHTALARTDLVCTTMDEDKAWRTYDVLAYAEPGTILYGSPVYGYAYAEASYNGVLTETFGGIWTAPDGVTFAADGKLTVTVTDDEEAAGEQLTLPVDNAVVMTFNHVTYSADEYDLSALGTADEVAELTVATAGVFDAALLDTCLAWENDGTPITLPAKVEGVKAAEAYPELYLSTAYDAEAGKTVLYAVVVYTGGENEETDPVPFPKEDSEPTVPDVTYAIVSTDPEIIASFYGKTEREIKRSLINGYLVENGMLVAAFLNTETGVWEKGYIESVSRWFDPYGGFTETVDVAKLLQYSAVLTLGANAEAQLNEACSLLQRGIVTVAAATDGVYALASIDACTDLWVSDSETDGDEANGYWTTVFLTDRYEMMSDAAAGEALLGFTNGVTTPIKATSDKAVEATPLTLSEDTLLVLINEPMQQTVVFRGIPTEAQSLYGAMATVFAASEELIVLTTDADLSAWEPKETVSEQYYTLLGTTEWELELNDDNRYTLTVSNVFDHAKNALGAVSVTLGKYDEVKNLLSALDNAAQGTVLTYDPNDEYLYATNLTQENLLILTDPDFTLVPIADADLASCTAEVITINATALDTADYDLTAFRYTTAAGTATDVPLALDTFRVITAPTAGVLDALTVSMNGMPLTAPLGTDYANGAEVKLALFAAEYTDEESGARTLRVIKLLTGGETEREDTEIPAPVYPAAPDYGFAVLTVHQDVVQPLLGLTWDEYMAAFVDGYYVEDGKVVCAVLDTATGELQKGYIDSVALYYDYTTASFNTYVDLAEMARLASLVTLNPDLAADYENARMIPERGIVLAVEQTDNVYTVADIYTAKGNAAGDTAATSASFFAERWYDPDMRGLVFDEAGMTNAIKASESDAAAPVQTTEDTVVAVVWEGGMAVRRGVQTEENSLHGIDTTYFAANEDLILVYTNMAQPDWDATEEKSTYYLPLPETSVELTLCEDGYLFTIENVIDLATLDTVTLTHVTNADGAYDLLYLLDIGIDGLFCRTGDSLFFTDDLSIDEALRVSTGLPDAYVYSFVDASTMELELEVAEDEYGAFGKENPLSGITVTVAFADRTGTDFSLYDTETMYADDTNVVEGLYEDLATVTVEEDTYYVYSLPKASKVTVTEPTPGVFSELELLASNRPLRAKNQKGEYEELGVIRMFSVGTYDAATNTADILLLYTLKPIA